MFAKIAHAYTVAEFGIKSFKPLLTNLILGRDKAPLHYIGCLGDDLPPKENDFHRVTAFHADLDRNQVKRRFSVINLRLFANLGAPQYHIVSGELNL